MSLKVASSSPFCNRFLHAGTPDGRWRQSIIYPGWFEGWQIAKREESMQPITLGTEAERRTSKMALATAIVTSGVA